MSLVSLSMMCCGVGVGEVFGDDVDSSTAVVVLGVVVGGVVDRVDVVVMGGVDVHVFVYGCCWYLCCLASLLMMKDR